MNVSQASAGGDALRVDYMAERAVHSIESAAEHPSLPRTASKIDENDDDIVLLRASPVVLMGIFRLLGTCALCTFASA
eukprot:SAG31_NODE_1406_length_8487_cov_4.584883_6_plen_78_part_00